MKNVLITGGAGFIGHHLIDHLLRGTDWNLKILDRLDISGNLNRLAEIGAVRHSRVRFHFHDLRAPLGDQLMEQIGSVDYIIHMAAATHVDRSINDPMDFVMNNVVATCNILDYARQIDLEKFVYFSTDEVFGCAPPGVSYREDDRYRSGNPYAATKAGAEELAVAYHNTYDVPVLITHTMNVIGERQHPEKFVPMTIAKIHGNEMVTIHSDPTRTQAGSRFYIHARHVAEAVCFLLKNGQTGEKYNVVGREEIDNLALAQRICRALGKKEFSYRMVDFHSSRPGHDLRYALDGSKMREMGFKTSTEGSDDELELSKLVSWYLNHPEWLYTFKTRSVA